MAIMEQDENKKMGLFWTFALLFCRVNVTSVPQIFIENWFVDDSVLRFVLESASKIKNPNWLCILIMYYYAFDNTFYTVCLYTKEKDSSFFWKKPCFEGKSTEKWCVTTWWALMLGMLGKIHTHTHNTETYKITHKRAHSNPQARAQDHTSLAEFNKPKF